MEPQNIDRRDSKKSNKGGGNKNQPRGSGGGGGGGKPTGGGEKQRSHSQKSGKRYQEIYKPPSLRSSKNRNSNSSSDQQNSQKGSNNHDEVLPTGSNNSSRKSNSNNSQTSSSGSGRSLGNISPQLNGNDLMNSDPSSNAYSLFGNGGGPQVNNGNSSVPSSPLISSRMQNSFNFNLAKRMFNVNAKEFQFLPIQQQQQHQAQQQQQISNFLSQFDPSLLYNNSPILASSGCYPLKQSKSSGNMNLLLQQAQQQQQAQAMALQQLQIAMGLNSLQQQAGNFGGGANANASNSNQFNRLCQSKSSGNVPGNGNRPRVRFDDEEVDFDDGDEDFLGGQLGNYLASLKLNGDLSALSGPGPATGGFPIGFPFQQQQQQVQMQQPKPVPASPQPVLKSALQKSRTGFYLNLYGNQQQQQQPHSQQMQMGSPTKPMYAFNPNMHSTPNYPAKMSSNMAGNGGQHPGQFSAGSSSSSVVKRSRSFGPGNHHHPRVSATALLTGSTTHCPISTGHSVYSDFCITKWPRVVQELVTAAVTGVERIPARNWIEMVNGIFDAMLCDYRPKKRDKNMMTTTVGEDSKSDGITTGEKATSGISASSDTNNDKFSTELSLAAGSSSSGEATIRKNQNADVAATEYNDHVRNLDDNEDDDEEEDEDDDTDLTSAAVHIFLYFIQREKDRTVMESLLNTCFASFQRLSSSSVGSANSLAAASGKPSRMPKLSDQKGKPSIPRQWCNFLRFLSTLYSQVKLIRRQKQSQQQPGHSMDEMSFSLLALLCDSCLATLRSPQSYTAEMMGCLFTVLTSIGRDMEGTFPLKMKQLLAAVRDALLGIGPYHQQQQQQHLYNPNSSSPSCKSSVSSLSPIVQKTLMQLIELHAANWQLPASAVRYYYSSVSNSKSTSSSAASSTTNGGGSSSVGNHQNQSQKSNNHNNNAGVPSTPTSHNYNLPTSIATVRPSSSSSVGSSSNDNDETKDNGAGGSGTSAVSSVNRNANGSMPEVEEKGNSSVTGSSENESTNDDTATALATKLENAPQP